MTNIRRVASGVAIAAALMASPPAGADTLADALILAYGTNPTLAAERARVRALDETFIQARSAGLPSVEATLSTSVRDQRTDSGAPPLVFSNSDTTGSNSASLSANQSLYRGGRTRASMDAALANIEAARASLVSVEQQVFLDVVTAYSDVRRDEAIVGIRANNVEVLARQLQAAQDRFDVGAITRTDVAQAEARLAGARTQLAAARAALDVSRAAYERVVGQSPGTLEPQPGLTNLPASFEDAVELAFDANPDVLAARYAESAAEAAAREAAGALLPSVSANVSANYNEGYFTGSSDSESLSGGASVSIPLFAGGVNSSRLRQARESASQARLQLRVVERAVREAVRSAWSNYDAAIAQIQSSREQVRANEIAFEGVEEEARVGLRTTLDTLNAEQELLDARLTLVTAERDAYVAGFFLLQAMGRLTATDLGLDVELYDPSVNLSDIRNDYVGLGVLEVR